MDSARESMIWGVSLTANRRTVRITTPRCGEDACQFLLRGASCSLARDRIVGQSPAGWLRYPSTRPCLRSAETVWGLVMSESTQTWVMVADAHGANVFAYLPKTDPCQPIHHPKKAAP